MFFCFCLFITKAKRSCYQQNVNLRVRRAVRRNEGQRGRSPEILGDCSPDSAVWVGTETFSRQKGAHFFAFNKLEGHPLNPHRPSYSYSTHKKKKKKMLSALSCKSHKHFYLVWKMFCFYFCCLVTQELNRKEVADSFFFFEV